MGMKNYLLIGAGVVLVLVFIFQSLQISDMKSKISGNAVKSGAIDMSGWTEDEKMQYEHHGVLPARLQSSGQNNIQNLPTMVGGC